MNRTWTAKEKQKYWLELQSEFIMFLAKESKQNFKQSELVQMKDDIYKHLLKSTDKFDEQSDSAEDIMRKQKLTLRGNTIRLLLEDAKLNPGNYSTEDIEVIQRCALLSAEKGEKDELFKNIHEELLKKTPKLEASIVTDKVRNNVPIVRVNNKSSSETIVPASAILASEHKS